MPASLETLTALTRANIAVGIVSNAQFYTPLILETLWHTSLSQLRLDPLVWSYEIRAAKPGSAPFIALIDAVASRGIQPHEILYVGNDMLNDVKVAQQNGIHAALFAGDRRSLRMRRDDQRVSGVVPQRVVTDLSQLLTIVTTKPPNRAKGIQS
jgi:putative hydrolase of the HAD superfamily